MKLYKGCKALDTEEIVKFDWDFTGVETNGYYLPIGTAQGYYYEMFVKNTTEDILDGNIEKACLRLEWNENDYVLKAYGGKVTSLSQLKCSHVGGEKWIMNCVSEKGYSHYLYGVKTDMKTWAMVSTCFEDGRNGWFVLTKSAIIPNDIFTDIIEHSKLLDTHTGDENYLFALPYDDCSST